MSNSINFPDRNHFNKIRERLWCGREFGQAAVMIGSGFSINAEKVNQSTPDLPLWKPLARKMYKELYPQNPNGEEQAVSNALGLASEYKATFGAEALNSFLIQAIPDQKHLPGKLHQILMSLPWSDVFTTNYDTLLERTQPYIHDRKYDVVHTEDDIPRSMKPRIVKLHGSFPSHQPFIVTEEDYRTYPHKFAPFVNTVQQSIMENVFCLIGFSGEDPNFLNWIGWVRDNLGDSQPPIYLCGLLSRLTEAKKQVLKGRNIITVDVSPLFPREKWPDSNYRHAKAIEWFLLSLMLGKPPNLTSWPKENSTKIEWQPSRDMPDFVPASKTFPKLKYAFSQPNHFNKLSSQELNRLREYWRSIRESYPGWVICPSSIRKEIWLDTKSWIEQIFISINNISAPESLFLLYELNWRLEITFTPLFTSWLKVLDSELSRYNPYPNVVEIETAILKPDNESFRNYNWTEIQEAWVALIFASIRAFREDYEEEKFKIWAKRLEKIAFYRSEWQSRFSYEKCLFHLSRFEDLNVVHELNAWSSSSNSDFWDVKRASILAEIGKLSEAENVAELALTRIRSRIQPYEPDYKILSEEAWTMLLLNMIKLNQRNITNYKAIYRDRWQKLREYKCDVWSEREYYQLFLNKQPPQQQPERSIRRGYFPKTQTRSYTLGAVSLSELSLPGFALLRMQEECATPMRCGMVVDKDLILNAAEWAMPLSPLWAITSVLRTEDLKNIKSILNIVLVQTLEEKHSGILYELLYSSLKTEVLVGGHRSQSYAGYLQARIQGTACISIRFLSQEIKKLIPFASHFYSNCLSGKSTYKYIFDSVNELFKSIAHVLSDIEVLEMMPDFLSLPLPDNYEEFSSLHDIFFYIKFSTIKSIPKDFDISSWEPYIEHLILLSKNKELITRSRAIQRLRILHHLNALSEAEQSSFAEALWSRVDQSSQLPKDTLLPMHAFLKLPEPEKGKVKEILKQYINTSPLPHLYSNHPEIGTSSSGLEHGIFIDYLNASWNITDKTLNQDHYIDWNISESIEILEKFSSWWYEEKDALLSPLANYSYIGDTVTKGIWYYIKILGLIILPRISDCNTEIKEKVCLLVEDIDESGFCILPVLPMLLFLNCENVDEISKKIKISFTSVKDEEVCKAIQSLTDWLILSEHYNIPKPPTHLLDDLVSRILSRTPLRLDCALSAASIIVQNVPQALADKHLSDLCIGLDCLLHETRIPTLKEMESSQDRSEIIAIVDRPDFREYASELAYSLYMYFLNSNKKILNSLTSWKDVSKAEKLPGVRKKWHGLPEALNDED